MRNRPKWHREAANRWSLSDGNGGSGGLDADGDAIGLTDQDAELWEAFVLDDDGDEAQPEYGDFWMEREDEGT